MNWWASKSRFDKNNHGKTTTGETTDVKVGTTTGVKEGTGTDKAGEVETTAEATEEALETTVAQTVDLTDAHRSKTARAETMDTSTTIGPVLNATIPTLHAAPCATDVKHHGQTTVVVLVTTGVKTAGLTVVMRDDGTTGSTTEEALGTTVAMMGVGTTGRTTEEALGTTVAMMGVGTTGRTTEEALGTTVARTVDLTDGTTDGATDGKTEGPSTATIGPVRNATTPISHSVKLATVAKHLVPVVAVVVVAATGEISALANKIETEASEGHRTATIGGHEASDKGTLTINHPVISENRRNLSGNVTIEARQ